MVDALVGYSGFVGSTLLRQARFGELYRSTNIPEIEGRSFDTVVCAAAPAQKWIANREPEADLRNVGRLISSLEAVKCRTFILISTVDVFGSPVGVDEDSPVEESELHPYGRHRRLLERFVEEHFKSRLIVRLPGLVGPGLRKNVIFDLLNGNNLSAIDSRAIFQFYPMVNLWYDIQIAIRAGLDLIHLTAEPLSVAEVSMHGFGRRFEQSSGGTAAAYDMRTLHAGLFGASGFYQYTMRETIIAVRSYAQSEAITVAGVGAGAST